MGTVMPHPRVCLLCAGLLGVFCISSYCYLALVGRTGAPSDSEGQHSALVRDGFLERVALPRDGQSLTVVAGPGDVLPSLLCSAQPPVVVAFSGVW